MNKLIFLLILSQSLLPPPAVSVTVPCGCVSNTFSSDTVPQGVTPSNNSCVHLWHCHSLLPCLGCLLEAMKLSLPSHLHVPFVKCNLKFLFSMIFSTKSRCFSTGPAVLQVHTLVIFQSLLKKCNTCPQVLLLSKFLQWTQSYSPPSPGNNIISFLKALQVLPLLPPEISTKSLKTLFAVNDISLNS